MLSKGILDKPLNPEGAPDFKGFLEEFQLSVRTIIEYDSAMALFFRTYTSFSQRNINIFLKNHPRMLYVNAVKWYCRYTKTDIEVPHIDEPARLPREEPTRNELLAIMNRLALEGTNDRIDSKFILRIQYETGKRINEVLTLRMKNIEFDNCILNFETKGGQYDSAPISAALRDTLKSYLRTDKNLFSGEKCFFTNYKKNHTAHIKFLEILSKTGDPDIRKVMKTHNFRRAVANEILEKSGGNLLMAKEALGHKDIRTTEKCYASERTKAKIKQEAFKLLASG